MRGVALLVATAPAACGAPSAAGDTGSTGSTAVVASFGDDGPSTAPGGTSDASTTTSGPAGETDPSPTTDGSTTTVDDSTTVAQQESSSGEPSPPCGTILATIRDFSAEHPDMAMPGGAVILPGIVHAELGPEGVPILDVDSRGAMETVTDADTFAQWYADVDGVNERFEVELEVHEESPGRTVFDSNAHLPIDGLGFGDEGEEHNFYFTTVVRTSLGYEGGEVLSFGGDDDVWVFIDGRLAADVGGQHAALYVDVELDALGLEPGQRYALDVFHADRGPGNVALRFELGDACGG